MADQNQPINLTLTLEEVTFIGNVLNELPTKSGAWLLVTKLNIQVQPQLPKTETAPEIVEEESK
jgi:hypothetical protein